MEDNKPGFVFNYLSDHKFMGVVCLYFITSTLLKTITSIDICLPCIWRTLFGFKCPGCGLTTAFIYLLKMDFNAAFKSNCLIFVLVPAGLFYIGWDFKKQMNLSDNKING